jgi:hypothetical protein
VRRRSFRDPVTHVLKAHGFVDQNEDGDLVQDEAHDFNRQPGQWRWAGEAWVPVDVPYTPLGLAPPAAAAPDPPAARTLRLPLSREDLEPVERAIAVVSADLATLRELVTTLPRIIQAGQPVQTMSPACAVDALQAALAALIAAQTDRLSHAVALASASPEAAVRAVGAQLAELAGAQTARLESLHAGVAAIAAELAARRERGWWPALIRWWRRVAAVVLVALLAATATAQVQVQPPQLRSFRDPTTGVLKAWGFITQNEPGDIAQIEADGFSLVPGTVRWNGTAWVAFTPTPTTSALCTALTAAATDVLATTAGKAAWTALKTQYGCP